MTGKAGESLFRTLSNPFPLDVVMASWTVIEVAPGGQKVFVIPIVGAQHYEARLDAAAPGWTKSFEVIDPYDPYIRCALTINGTTYDGIGDATPSDETFEGKQKRAFIRACQAAGVGKYLQFIQGAWVPYDKEANRITPPRLPGWALPGGCGYPENAPGSPRQPKMASDKNLRKPANSTQAQSRTMESPAGSRPAVNHPARLAQSPATAEKQPDDAIANEQAMKAWSDLVQKAHQAGITDIEPVPPQIQVGELRQRYAALKKQMPPAQNISGEGK